MNYNTSFFAQYFCNFFACETSIPATFLFDMNICQPKTLGSFGIHVALVCTTQSCRQLSQILSQFRHEWLLLSGVGEDKTGLGAPQGFQRLCLSTLGVSWGAYQSIPEVFTSTSDTKYMHGAAVQYIHFTLLCVLKYSLTQANDDNLTRRQCKLLYLFWDRPLKTTDCNLKTRLQLTKCNDCQL